MRKLELLSPAKNLESGIAAIDCGADAVYIGANRFGARQAVGNSNEDIAKLCEYAHQFNCKVYVTVNTIIYDNEIEATQQLLKELGKIGVDAILVQDMGILKLALPQNVCLHASTQTDNRSAEKVQWLADNGFQRVVLARELSLREIRDIHKDCPDTELEVFVHGALCVSYSGVCYASENCFGRSANRGTCAQFCRLKFDLIDANGNNIAAGAHFLSLKDMCRINSLEELADAGVTSFKIEGRLKDINYVRNVTAAYNRKLNEIIRKRPNDYCRSSMGTCNNNFLPDLKKTFNRGFTEYFLEGRNKGLASFYTPKAIGEYVGKVKEIKGNSFNVSGTATFANGDGLCFINSDNELEGFRINKAEGNRLFLQKIPKALKRNMALYRNNDQQFNKELANDRSHRKLPIDIEIEVEKNNISIKARIKNTDITAEETKETTFDKAQKPQAENIRQQMSKLGNSIFYTDTILTIPKEIQWFIPNSLLSELRHELIDKLEKKLKKRTEQNYQTEKARTGKSSKQIKANPSAYPYPYMYNIANNLSKKFYEEEGMKNIRPAFEISKTRNAMIMQCRYCLRYEIGQCKKRTDAKSLIKDPLRLRLPDGRTFRLEFDCAHCQMNIYSDI